MTPSVLADLRAARVPWQAGMLTSRGSRVVHVDEQGRVHAARDGMVVWVTPDVCDPTDRATFCFLLDTLARREGYEPAPDEGLGWEWARESGVARWTLVGRWPWNATFGNRAPDLWAEMIRDDGLVRKPENRGAGIAALARALRETAPEDVNGAFPGSHLPEPADVAEGIGRRVVGEEP